MRKSILVLVALFTFSTTMISCRETEEEVDEIELETYDDGLETTEDEFETTEDNEIIEDDVLDEDI